MPSSLALRKFLLYLCLLTLTQCSKCKNDPTPQDPAAQLPPATQTGAGTFGCLVNGQVYTPQGNTGTNNLGITYDPGFRGGSIVIETYRTEGGGLTKYLSIDAAPIKAEGSYSLNLGTGIGEVLYSSGGPAPCGFMYDSRDVTYRKATLLITRLDVNSRIIAGTFNATIARAGCDTLRITQGRFDAKF
ncbi:hypothetical protein [Hymenobacter ruricola]|uniref:Lipoprotein n=1 Tax=Hymenobacter ruricola TaxID=2791023 RepID=A0ABS0I8Q8_9BACT|nr:hypothetical protein [Hymenobacter ruricola]MBF9223294.1 hypothetical protein [Hymenobacter ruricola]